MEEAHPYKKIESKFTERLFNKIAPILKKAADIFKKIKRVGKQRFTVMLIPHSEKKIFNFQINVFTLVFIFVILITLISGFFLLSTHYSGSSRLIAARSTALEQSEASLEVMREEIADLQKTVRLFERTLTNTLEVLGISETDTIVPETARGDLSSFKSIEEVGEGQLREVMELQNLNTYLDSVVEPLQEIGEVLTAQKELIVDIPTLWPLKGVRGRITNNFGPAEHPFTHQWYLHKGIDIAYGYNVPIVSTANGKVLTRDYEPMGFGHYILIRHKYGFYTKYAHLQTVKVQPGQEVHQGQVIGTMGNSGLSTGPHLHYEVRIGSEVVDPSKYLNISNIVSNLRAGK